MNIAAGLAGLKAAADLTKAVRDAAKAGTLKPDEFAGRVGEIYDYIIDSKDALVDAKDRIQELKDEIRNLKTAADEEQCFQFMHGVYWKTSDVLTVQEDEHGKRIKAVHWDGPFCPLCKDDRQKAVRLKLQEGGFQNSTDRLWECEIHKTDYRAPNRQA